MSEPPDERRHPPGPEPLWTESWYVDFADGDGRGGFLRLAFLPGAATAWLWAAWVEPGSLILVRDHEVPLPRGNALEVRAGGLWADLVCETPMTHWSFGLEAFGVSFPEPADAWGDERGQRCALGFGLEWEAAMPPFDHPQPGGRPSSGHYQHAGAVHGEVLVGDRRVPFDGWGERDHFWGVRDWWSAGWHWSAFRVAGGERTMSVARPDRPGAEHAKGYVALGGEDAHPVVWAEVETEWGEGGLPRGARYHLEGGGEVAVEVVGAAPLLVPEPSGPRVSRLARALCRFEASEGPGSGWAEWLVTGDFS